MLCGGGFKEEVRGERFIFMQDFFCSKIYANDVNGPCTKCLDKCLFYAYKNTCGVRSKLGWPRLTQRILTRLMWKRVLPKVNHVATTTKEQMSFYKRFGIPEDKHSTLYLPFSSNKLSDLKAERGDYVIGIAQDRVEKGFQFIPRILHYTKCKVVLAYSNEDTVKDVSNDINLRPYLKSGLFVSIDKPISYSKVKPHQPSLIPLHSHHHPKN